MIENEQNSELIENTPITESNAMVDSNEEEQSVSMQEALPELSSSTSGLVEQVGQEVLEDIRERTNFQKRTEDVIERAVNVELEKREIIILDQEQKNELAKLKLKLDKKAMREEAKAQAYERKRKAAMLRYGYLYEPYEVEIIDPNTGKVVKETRYKNFTTNKFINKYKEFSNFWANLADSTKNIIKKAIKIIIWLAIISGVIFILYNLIKWLLNSNLSNLIAA